MREITRYSEGRRYVCKPVESGVWYIFWSENRRSRRTSTGTKDETEADAFLDEWLKLDEKMGAALTCRDLWELKYPDMTPDHRCYYAGKPLMSHFGDLRPRDVTQAREDEYIRKRGVAQSTIRLELSVLRASWNNGLKKRLLTEKDLPVLGPLPEPSPPRDRWLRDDEAALLLATAEELEERRVWAFLNLALETAARRTAIQELTWEQVDWETGVIHYLKPGARQSRKRRASVPISDKLKPVLQELYDTRKDGYVIGAGARVNIALAKVAKHAKIEGVSPHVLRHTAATRMARRGVPLWIIAKILGNTVEQVEKVYAKHAPEMLLDGVNAISGAG